MSKHGFVTFCDNNNYAKGALVLARSLRHVGTSADLVCLITNKVSDEMRSQVRKYHRIRSQRCSAGRCFWQARHCWHNRFERRCQSGFTQTSRAWRHTHQVACLEIDPVRENGVLWCRHGRCSSHWRSFPASRVVCRGRLWLAFMFQYGAVCLLVRKFSLVTYSSYFYQPIIGYICQAASPCWEFRFVWWRWSRSVQRLFFWLVNGGHQPYSSIWLQCSRRRHLYVCSGIQGKRKVYVTFNKRWFFKHYANEVRVVHFLGATKPWSSRHAPAASSFGHFWSVWWQFYTEQYSAEGKQKS